APISTATAPSTSARWSRRDRTASPSTLPTSCARCSPCITRTWWTETTPTSSSSPSTRTRSSPRSSAGCAREPCRPSGLSTSCAARRTGARPRFDPSTKKRFPQGLRGPLFFGSGFRRLELGNRLVEDLHEFLAGDGFLFVEELGELMQAGHVFAQEVLRLFVLPAHELDDPAVDLRRGLRRAGEGRVPAEVEVALRLQGDHAELLAHAV